MLSQPKIKTKFSPPPMCMMRKQRRVANITFNIIWEWFMWGSDLWFKHGKLRLLIWRCKLLTQLTMLGAGFNWFSSLEHEHMCLIWRLIWKVGTVMMLVMDRLNVNYYHSNTLYTSSWSFSGGHRYFLSSNLP